MTTYQTEPRSSSPPMWVRIVLGAVLIFAGLVVVCDVTFATIVSTVFIAAAAIAAGGFEIVHAFWTRGWGAPAWQILLGALYVVFGIALLNQPASGGLMFTYVLGTLLAMSGFIRVLLSVRRWNEAGAIMFLSGVFGMLAGFVVLTGFPRTGLWVLALVLGIDLVGHGLAWLNYSWSLPALRRS